jgi:hypothetical protein
MVKYLQAGKGCQASLRINQDKHGNEKQPQRQEHHKQNKAPKAGKRFIVYSLE